MEGCPLWFVATCGMLRCESWEQPSIQPFVSLKECTPDMVPCTPNTPEFVWYKVLSFAMSEVSECWAAPAGKKLLCSPWGLCLKGCATLGLPGAVGQGWVIPTWQELVPLGELSEAEICIYNSSGLSFCIVGEVVTWTNPGRIPCDH